MKGKLLACYLHLLPVVLPTSDHEQSIQNPRIRRSNGSLIKSLRFGWSNALGSNGICGSIFNLDPARANYLEAGSFWWVSTSMNSPKNGFR